MTDKKKSNRVTIRFDDGVMESLQAKAKELDMNWNHFASISLAVGANTLHKQFTALHNIPDSAWQEMAMGFSRGMDEEKMMQAFVKMADENPALFHKLAASLPPEE